MTTKRKRARAIYYDLWFAETEGAICTRADLKGVSEYFVYQPEPVKEWPEGVTLYAGEGPLEDYLFPTVVDWVPISERVKRALEELGATEGVQFLPIRVVREATGEEVPGYYVLHVWRHISALDKEHTKFIKEPSDDDPYPQLNIAVVALRWEAIKDVDIFRLKEKNVSIYVSRRVKQRLQEIGATGFKWIPVRSY